MTILGDHFERVRNTLIQKGKEVQLAKHAGLTGTARELIVSDFFETSFPKDCNFVSGEIIDSDGGRSGQVDLLITPSFSPHFSLAGREVIALADAVMAAIEVKSDLTTGNASTAGSNALDTALQTTQMIKERKVVCDPWPWECNKNGQLVKLRSIPVSIVAYSGPTKETLKRKLTERFSAENAEYMPNTITVLERNYTLVREDDWYFTSVNPNPLNYAAMSDTGACLADLYYYLLLCVQSWMFRRPFTPLASYLQEPAT